VSGELVVRVGDQRRSCRTGDLLIVPPNTLHGFRVVSETVVEVVAEHDIGTFFPVRQADGTRRLVEVYTVSPWNAPPPRPGEHTTEEEIQQILQHVDIEPVGASAGGRPGWLPGHRLRPQLVRAVTLDKLARRVASCAHVPW
jgi:hypothetical protein